MKLFSILIPSLENRRAALHTLLHELSKQTVGFEEKVEVITLIDNKEITTGAKRNELLKKATGKYIAFIDDDDRIYSRYVREILAACETDCDCVSISGLMTTNGSKPIRWQISKDFKDETVKKFNKPYYLRHTNHLAPVKREIALKCGFPDKSNAEDSEYSKRLRESGLLRVEVKIEPLLYHYRFITTNKEYK